MISKYTCIALCLLTVGCGGGSSDETSTPAPTVPDQNSGTTPPPDINPDPTPDPVPDPTPDPDPTPEPNPPAANLDNVIVPEQFDWSMYKEDEVKIKTVTSTMRPDGELAGLGGKHFMKIVALDGNLQEVENPLQRSLTSRTGETRTKLKLPNEWYGIKVEVTVGSQVCSKVFSKEEVTGEIEVPCDIEMPAGDGE
ncbi:hypothetical protein [Pseudoalteromonas citrea]|nr:hypothetical protein [Pseudoalteromonas citrea]